MGWWVTVISSAGLGWCMAELGSDLRLTAPRANVNPAHTEKLCTDFRGGIFLNYMYCSLFYFFYHEYCMVFFLSLNKVNSVLFWVLFVWFFFVSVLLHSSQTPKEHLSPCKWLAMLLGLRSLCSPITSLLKTAQPSPLLHGTTSEEEFQALAAWLLFPVCVIWIIKIYCFFLPAFPHLHP